MLMMPNKNSKKNIKRINNFMIGVTIKKKYKLPLTGLNYK